MARRRRLPHRRSSETFVVECDGGKFVATVANFEDGRVGEIFLSSGLKAGSAAGIMASDSAIAASLALQHGCSLEVLRRALSRDGRGDASGPLGIALDLIADD